MSRQWTRRIGRRVVVKEILIFYFQSVFLKCHLLALHGDWALVALGLAPVDKAEGVGLGCKTAPCHWKSRQQVREGIQNEWTVYFARIQSIGINKFFSWRTLRKCSTML